MAGVNLTHVPYKGAPQAWTDLLGGHMNLTFSSIPPVLPHINAGRLQLLGISSARRLPQLPDIKSQFEVLGYNAAGSSPEDFAAFLRAESQKYANVIKLPESSMRAWLTSLDELDRLHAVRVIGSHGETAD